MLTLTTTATKFSAKDGIMSREIVLDLYSTHEEADCRMFFHLKYITAPKKVVIRTTDTDCLIIALGLKHLYDQQLQIWLEVGLQSNNSLRYININALHAKLGETLSKSLLAYHAISGCDYTASFCRRGKVKPFKVLEKDENMQDILYEMGNQEELSENTVEKLEEFVCRIYGKNKTKKVNNARTDIFLEKYRTKNVEDRLSNVKRLDGSMMPPCLKVLMQKLKRTHLITRRWASAAMANPPFDEPEESGWRLVGGRASTGLKKR